MPVNWIHLLIFFFYRLRRWWRAANLKKRSERNRNRGREKKLNVNKDVWLSGRRLLCSSNNCMSWLRERKKKIETWTWQNSKRANSGGRVCWFTSITDLNSPISYPYKCYSNVYRHTDPPYELKKFYLHDYVFFLMMEGKLQQIAV